MQTLGAMDLSPAVAWSFPLLGVFIAVRFGARRARAGDGSISRGAFGLSLLLGFTLVVPQIATHTVCIEFLKLCRSHGDANMSYWFQSFICIPAYCVAAVGAWQFAR